MLRNISYNDNLSFMSYYINFLKNTVFRFKKFSKKYKLIVISNSSILFVFIGSQLYITLFYINTLPLPITIASFLSLIVYLYLGLFSLIKYTKLQKANYSLKKVRTYNENLNKLNEELHKFKHDFSNILQCIDGYIVNENMSGLKNYFSGIKKECTNINNIASLNPNLISDPGLYSLISSKYTLAEDLGLDFNIEITSNLSDITVPPYILTRILGILLDNSIEAAKLSKEKEIFFSVSSSLPNVNTRKYIIMIKNSYLDKNIDIDKLKEKGFTSKASKDGSHGIGLWEVDKILKRNENIDLFTSKNDLYFTQELEIYENIK